MTRDEYKERVYELLADHQSIVNQMEAGNCTAKEAYKSLSNKDDTNYEILLFNAIVLLEEAYGIQGDSAPSLGELISNLGMTKAEYRRVMSSN